MFTLKQNDDKLAAFNVRRKEFIEQYPEYKDTHFAQPIKSIDDIFIPYSHWIESLTEAEKAELKLIPDGDYDFTGFYVCADFNDHYHVAELTDYQADRFDYEYGVVDNASQIVENCEISDDSIILMTPVFREPDEPCSGWRWHKWGPYYGVQNSHCEYLNDEPDIEMIYCFSIRKVSPCNVEEE